MATLPNTLVFFSKDGSFQGGACLEENKKGILVQMEGGRTVRVPARDVSFLREDGALKDPAAGARMASRICSLAAETDLHAVWDLLLEEDMPGFTHQDIAELCDPAGDAVFQAAVRCALEGPESLFKRKGDRWVPVSPKTVQQRLQQKEALEQKLAAEQNVVEMLAMAREEGTLDSHGAAQEVKAALTVLSRAAMETDKVDSSASRLLALLYPGDTRPYPLLAFDFMVSVGLWDEDEDVNLMRLDPPQRFSDNALEQGEKVVEAVDGIISQREDRTDLVAIAIDDADTVEVDDALALEKTPAGWNVHVFIADVASGVARDSALDQEAALRASTVYHPTRRIPMLPPSVSENALSLNQGVRRPALDHVFYLDEAFQQFDFAVKPCVVQVDKQMTYEEADRLLADGENTHASALKTLWEIATLRFAQRRNQGAITFYPLEHKVRVIDGKVSLKVIDNYSPSRRLVAEFMVSTGSCTGTLLHQMGIPVIYRNQEPPEGPLDWTEEAARDPVYINATIRRMRRAKVTLTPGRHGGLGLDSYCQVTSPLRRYGDLLMQRQLHSALVTRVAAYSEGELLDAMAVADDSSGQIRKVVQNAENYWKLAALKCHIGDQVSATVVYTDRGRAWVQLDDFGVNVRIFPKSVVDPGARMTLKVVHVEPRTDSVVLNED